MHFERTLYRPRRAVLRVKTPVLWAVVHQACLPWLDLGFAADIRDKTTWWPHFLALILALIVGGSVHRFCRSASAKPLLSSIRVLDARRNSIALRDG